MHILVTGGTGFIGSALLPALAECEHSVTVLSRQSIANTASVGYISDLDEIDASTPVDAVINLAGASLAGRRWTAAYKREIVASRLDTTAALIDWIERREHRPSTLLSASAIGYYGHQGDELLDEIAEAVPGFAQQLCQDWEQQAMRAPDLGVRTCLLRLGVVLARGGGAFQQMAAPFALGVGNWIGDGRQWLSWVHRDDVVRAILFLLQDESLSGPFNLTAPEPVTSRGFCEGMRQHYRTLLNLPMPAPVMRLLVGEMADELLIHGQRVVPVALEEAGFRFSYPQLSDALAAIKAS